MTSLLHHRGVELDTEADAYEFLEQLRWGDDGPTECPHCRSTKGAWFLKPKDPAGRKSKGGSSARSQRRVWKCRENSCRRQFSVLTTTVMHATKMPVRAWVYTIFELCEDPYGTSAREVAERWDLTPKSAWAMLERIQSALAQPADQGLFGGAVPRWIELDDESDPVVIDVRDSVRPPVRAAYDPPAPTAVDVPPERSDDVDSAILRVSDSGVDERREVTEPGPPEVPDRGMGVCAEVPDPGMGVSAAEVPDRGVGVSAEVPDSGVAESVAVSDSGAREPAVSGASGVADRVRSDVEQLLAEAFADSSIPIGDHLRPTEIDRESTAAEGPESSRQGSAESLSTGRERAGANDESGVENDGTSGRDRAASEATTGPTRRADEPVAEPGAATKSRRRPGEDVPEHASSKSRSGRDRAVENRRRKRRGRRPEENAQPVDNSLEAAEAGPRKSSTKASAKGRATTTDATRGRPRSGPSPAVESLGEGWLRDALGVGANDADAESKPTPRAAETDLELGPRWARPDDPIDAADHPVAEAEIGVPPSGNRAGGRA